MLCDHHNYSSRGNKKVYDIKYNNTTLSSTKVHNKLITPFLVDFPIFLGLALHNYNQACAFFPHIEYSSKLRRH